MTMNQHRYPYQSCPKLYEDYYVNQVGHGLPVFVGGGGRRLYRGHGFGSLLAGIGRAVVPLLKKGGKALLKEGARTGLRVAQDVMSGQRLGSALKQRAGQSGKRLLTQVLSSSPSPSRRRQKRIKTKRTAQGKQSGSGQQRRRQQPPKKKKQRRMTDIFG